MRGLFLEHQLNVTPSSGLTATFSPEAVEKGLNGATSKSARQDGRTERESFASEQRERVRSSNR